MDKLSVGLPLTLTLIGSEIITGNYYGYDSSNSLLILTTALPPTTSQLTTLLSSSSTLPQNRNYHLIKSTQIKSLEILSPTPQPLLALAPPPSLLTPTATASRVKSALQSAEQSSDFTQLEELPEEMRQIVMSMRKTLPVKVQNGLVIVMEEVKIKSPYAQSDVTGNNPERVERVRLVVRPSPLSFYLL